MIKSRARFQSAGRRPNGCGNCSDSESAVVQGFTPGFFSLDGDAAPASAFSTIAIRSLISVPEYKLTHFHLLGEVEDSMARKIGGRPRLRAALRGGGRFKLPGLPVLSGRELPGSRLPAGLASFSLDHLATA